MTEQEALNKLMEIMQRQASEPYRNENTGDWEDDHHEADRVLCKLLVALGHEQVVEMWRNIHKWYA